MGYKRLITSKNGVYPPGQFGLWNNYATKNKKTMRKNINTKKILIISHLLEDMLFKYFNKAPCAPSTFARVSSMFSSILQIKYFCQPHQCLSWPIWKQKSSKGLNYTFGPRVLVYSRNWSCPFKTEQNYPSIIIFVAFFVLPLILFSKNVEK